MVKTFKKNEGKNLGMFTDLTKRRPKLNIFLKTRKFLYLIVGNTINYIHV